MKAEETFSFYHDYQGTSLNPTFLIAASPPVSCTVKYVGRFPGRKCFEANEFGKC
jgi:hypothetical protein